MADPKSWGYPTRENVNNLLDKYIELVTNHKDILAKLEFVLLMLETEEGIFTFPDGDSFPAGIRVTELIS